MKKLFFSTFFVAILMAFTLSSPNLESEKENSLASLVVLSEANAEYGCAVSSTPSENNGFCRALSSGNGDMCFTYGSGTACNGTFSY